jgi:hypothetical protein
LRGWPKDQQRAVFQQIGVAIFVMSGFTVSFDGKQLFTAQDNTITGAGRVALWTKADGVTYFDTIAIIPPE